MNCISDFFQRFLKLEKNNSIKTAAVLEAIKETTGLELNKETLEMSEDKIKIKCSPVFRNEIFLHQNQIEEILKKSKIFLRLT